MSDVTGGTIADNSPSSKRIDFVQSGEVSGDRYSPTILTSANRATASGDRGSSAEFRRGGVAAHGLEPKTRHKCEHLFAACVQNLVRATDSDEDFFNRNNALSEVKEALNELWALRTLREEGFAELINVLQIAFVQRSVESFSGPQLQALRSIFESAAETEEFDDDVCNRLTTELIDGGIDVFRELV